MKRNCSVITILILIVFNFNSFYLSEIENKKMDNLEDIKIKLATIKVADANKTKNYKDIKIAKNLISLISTDLVKEELNLNIDNLELEIAKEKVFDDYNNLLRLVENNLNLKELDDAIKKINNVIYTDVKEELLDRTKELKVKIEENISKMELLDYSDKMKYIDTVKVISNPLDSKVIETISGKITAFTPYCSDGCAGFTASGKFVGDGDIYDYDSEYGMVHIVAADKSYPFGTIVRIKNLAYFGEDIYAIVLDRGGAIGKGKRAIFDLLFATEDSANNFGVSSVVECEILRLGY